MARKECILRSRIGENRNGRDQKPVINERNVRNKTRLSVLYETRMLAICWASQAKFYKIDWEGDHRKRTRGGKGRGGGRGPFWRRMTVTVECVVRESRELV